MKVKATRMGYYGHKRRKEGEVFNIKSEKFFSKNWMVKALKKKKFEPEFENEIEESEEEEMVSEQKVI